jgi:hypothetical protein
MLAVAPKTWPASAFVHTDLAKLTQIIPDSMVVPQGQELSRRILGSSAPIVAFSEAYKRALAPQIEVWREYQETWTKDLAGLAKAAEALKVSSLPPNLRPIANELDISKVLDLLEADGIPLYLVPRASVASSLLSAPDSAKRRAVLNRRFDDIVRDCSLVLEQCQDARTSANVTFVRHGIGAVDAGHSESGQALFTNILDSLLRSALTEPDRRRVTSHKRGATPEALNDLALREAYVMLPIWHAYEEFWHSKGDPTPHEYSRHASAHAVSGRQFSKRNTAVALMLVTSFLGYLNGL